MRPVSTIPDSFSDPDDTPATRLPLLDTWVERREGAQPFAGWTLLLVQHQLSNHGPQTEALTRLGADPERIYWLDVPYTSRSQLRDYVSTSLGVPRENFRVCSDYRVLDPYAPYQLRRAVELVLKLARRDEPILVLDDGAYVLEALSVLREERWPRRVTIVEQTTRGMIKLAKSAALRAAAGKLPIIDVARSTPKRTLEPPFIAMSVCACLERQLRRSSRGTTVGRCLVLGYGAIGEQVATFVHHQFVRDRKNVFVFDTNSELLTKAQRRGFSSWTPSDFATRFDLVVGCSGSASFELGDYVYLEDGARLASASSGAVELSRRSFVELADASPLDDLEVLRDGIDESNLHSDIPFRLVDRTATFLNAGFPVNFDGRISTIPARFIQPTPVVMLQGALQAVATETPGVHDLDPGFCDWIEHSFREELGEEAHLLTPPPEAAW